MPWSFTHTISKFEQLTIQKLTIIVNESYIFFYDIAKENKYKPNNFYLIQKLYNGY